MFEYLECTECQETFDIIYDKYGQGFEYAGKVYDSEDVCPVCGSPLRYVNS